MKKKWLLNVFFSMLFVSASFAQLPMKNDPNYLTPIADASRLNKFTNQLLEVYQAGLRHDVTTGGTITVTGAPTEWHMLGVQPDTTTGLTCDLTSTVFGFAHAAGLANANFNGVTTHPGATIVAHSGVPLTVNWVNNLGYTIPVQVDSTIMMAYNMGIFKTHNISDLGVPMTIHVHGSHVEAASDGDPQQWWNMLYATDPTNPLSHGPAFTKTNYYYDNSQEAATLWYHDHSLGTTRILAYMGFAGFYLLRDAREDAFIAANQIPNGKYEVELALQDKMFWPNGKLAWPNAPSTVDPGPFMPLPASGNATMVPEMFGDVICVNGEAWPYMNVEPRMYRIRLLDGSDSRFYNLKITAANGKVVPFKIIGSEDGFLPNFVTQNTFLIAPGERYDMILDFRGLAGQTFTMTNDAPTPYPGGDPVLPGSPASYVMQFKVVLPLDTNFPEVTLPATFGTPVQRLARTGATRKLLLWETRDEYGRIQPVLGTVAQGHIPFMNMDGTSTITETPVQNTNEVWEIYNTTTDAHPMHLHLVAFQFLNRQAFTATQDVTPTGPPLGTGKLSNIVFTGPAIAPRGYELGPKDTKVMYPGEVTRIIARFDKAGRYVWHCHILSHEEHDMMRYFEVLAPIHKDVAQTAMPTKFSLEQNYPNPFNPSTTIKFTLPENALVTLKVYDILGKEVGTLINQMAPQGSHEVVFDASKLASGMYVYRLTAGSFSETKKMLLMK